MKKTIIIFSLLLIIINQSYSQEDYKYLEEISAAKKTNIIYESRHNLKNNLLMRTDTLIYSFNSNHLISRIEDGSTYTTPLKEFFYNTDNKVSRMVANIGGNSFVEMYEYDFGRIKTIKIFNRKNELINVIKFFYNKDGNLVKKTSKIKKYSVDYLYYNVNIIKTDITNNTNLKREIEYTYDTDNKLSTEKVFDTLKKSKNKRKYLKLKVEYFYDKNRNLTEKKVYETEKAFEKIIYYYSEDMTLIEWKKVDISGKTKFISKLYY